MPELRVKELWPPGLSGLELFSIWAPKLILMKHQGVAPPRAPGPVRPGFYPAWAGRQVQGVRYVRLRGW